MGKKVFEIPPASTQKPLARKSEWLFFLGAQGVSGWLRYQFAHQRYCNRAGGY